MKYAAAFGGHLFYDSLLQDRAKAWSPWLQGSATVVDLSKLVSEIVARLPEKT